MPQSRGGCGFIDFGHYSLGAGGIVIKEDAAVVREMKEETGLYCSVVGLVGFRNRPDPDVNTSYVVFLLRTIEGQLIPGYSDEVIQRGFYTLDQVLTMDRLTSLSRELAVAALTDQLCILHAVSVPGMHGRAPVTLFMGSGE